MSTHEHQSQSFIQRLQPLAFARLLAALALGCASLTGCVGENNSSMATDTKTNWLDSCEADADCGDGLACLCGVCTKTCDDAEACSALGSDAECGTMSGCADEGAVCTAPAAAGDDEMSEPSESEPTESAQEPDDDEQHGDPGPSEVPDGSASEGEDDAPVEESDEGAVDAGAPTTDPAEPSSDAGSGMTCPRPLDEYALFGEECFAADFNCAGYFMDECGCGCDEDEEPAGPMCGHDADEYRGDTESCKVIRFECGDDAQMFSNECGCGCEPKPAESDGGSCDIPGREYVSHSPTQCAATTFLCESGEQFFDQCGCGCFVEADGGTSKCDDPSREYASRDPEQCQLIDLNCEEGGFSDECGCGCIVEVDPACQIEGRSYVSRDPEECQLIDFLCVEGTMHFGDECGCGCATAPTDQ